MSMEIQEHVALGPLTTLGVGGKARWFAEARADEDVREAVGWAKERGVPLFVLGGGSNLLVSDQGFSGLVLRVEVAGIAEVAPGLFEVGAGEGWDGFVQQVVTAGFQGVECLAGIPGSVGGTPVQNVGAYGQEVAETIESVRVFDRERMEFAELSKAECHFRYRESRFNTEEPGRFVVVRVVFRLRAGGTPELKYADLKKWFAERMSVALPPTRDNKTVTDGAPGGEAAMNGVPGRSVALTPTRDNKTVTDGAPGGGGVGSPSLVEVAEAVRAIRRRKGMVIDPGDPDSRSAGSFFRNPVVEAGVLERIARELHILQEDVPHWPAGVGKVKLPAAWLLENAGFTKGFSGGRVGISTKHTLALVNRGGATCADVERFQDEIVGCVAEKFGVVLTREPVKLG